MFPYPAPVNKSDFSSVIKGSRYGLPESVSFCKRCVISNQRPGSTAEFRNHGEEKKSTIFIDSEGVCDACRVAEKKSLIDWESRERELKELCDKYRKDDGSYDCLVPGSGGKDSFFQAHVLKYKYGMNPLTCTWAPHIYTDWGYKNHQAWIHAGFDNLMFTPNGRVHRLITRLAVETLLHPFQPFILGQKNLAPKIAALYNIPLIFYGENEAEYGNAKADMNSALRSWEYFSSQSDDNIYLGGCSVAQLKHEMGLSSNDLDAYLPIDPSILADKKIEVHYLGYYLKWHPQGAYYYAIDHSDFKAAPERTAGTYSTYNSIDDRMDDFHYHTTWIKFGLGRASYDAAQEIRSGDITREEGQLLVRKYDGEFPERWSSQIFEYLSLPEKQFPIASKQFEQPVFSREYYDLLCDKFRSTHLWQYTSEHGWSLRHNVFDTLESNLFNPSDWRGNYHSFAE